LAVNGSTVAEVEDKDYTKGAISFRTTLGSTVNFDNFKVTGEFNDSWLNRELRKGRQ
jgi:hypothetical protein